MPSYPSNLDEALNCQKLEVVGTEFFMAPELVGSQTKGRKKLKYNPCRKRFVFYCYDYVEVI